MLSLNPNRARTRNLLTEIVVRFILFLLFVITDDAAPYRRTLQPDELWLYKYPHMESIYPGKLMWVTVFTVPTVVFVWFYFVRRDAEDLIQSTLGVIMSIYIAGSITNMLKILVGRPRPDFLARCFPDGFPEPLVYKGTLTCSGEEEFVLQGLKSFPSGHSALSFSSLTFVSLYLAGKLQVFNRARGQGWRFIVFITPLVWALIIAVSRTSDYHHHWQDVLVGSIIGALVAYGCYWQVYPCLNHMNSHLCLTQHPPANDPVEPSDRSDISNQGPSRPAPHKITLTKRQ